MLKNNSVMPPRCRLAVTVIAAVCLTSCQVGSGDRGSAEFFGKAPSVTPTFH